MSSFAKLIVACGLAAMLVGTSVATGEELLKPEAADNTTTMSIPELVDFDVPRRNLPN